MQINPKKIGNFHRIKNWLDQMAPIRVDTHSFTFDGESRRFHNFDTNI